MIDLTRGELLKAGAIGSVALSLRGLAPRSSLADDGGRAIAEPPVHHDYRDLYRHGARGVPIEIEPA